MSALASRHGYALLGTGALVLSVLVTLFWYLGYAQALFEDEGREMRVEFGAVPQLQVGDPVRVDGRQEGRVREISDVDGGRGAIVRFDVAEDAGPIFGDAEVQLRWKSLLGGAFYLEVDRGTPRGGALGDRTIPREQTVTQVEVEDLTTVFSGRTLTGLATTFDELSRGLRDPDAVPGLLDAVADVSPDLRRGLRAVRGQDRDVDLRGTIQGTAATVSALDAPRDELRALVVGAAATLRTTGGRGAELRQILDRGPRATDRVRTTLARLEGTLDGVDGLVKRLNPAADDLGPTLRDLRPTLSQTDTLLRRARPLVRRLRPTATSLARLGRSGTDVLRRLQPSLDRIDQSILPFMAEKDPGTGKPMSVMIGGTAAGFGGSAGQQDANGHTIRFPASIGTSSAAAYLPCESALTDPTVEQMFVCTSLGEAFKEYFEYVPELDSARGGTP